MFCSKCGSEIMDEAVICPKCGCQTANFSKATSETSAATPSISLVKSDSQKAQEFIDKLTPAFIMSVISLVLCLGVGIIFAIISSIMLTINKIPDIKLADPIEAENFEKAKKRYKLATTFSSIAASVSFAIIAGAIVLSLM